MRKAEVTKDKFLEILRTALKIKEPLHLSIDTQMSDLKEWDSLGQIEVLLVLQEEFNIALEMDELISIKSVQDIIAVLNSRKINLE